MKHPWGYLVLSVALHVSAGWLLHSLRATPEPLAWQAPMAIQLVSLAQAVEPAPAQSARPHAPPPQAAAPAPAPLKAPVLPKPVPPAAKPLPVKTQPAIVKSAPAPRPEPRASRTAVASAASRQITSNPVSAPANSPSTPAPAAPPVLSVVSLRPSFVSPPPPPRYPSQARRRNQQGIVRVEVCLDEHGKQLKLTLVRSSGVTSLDQAALEAVTQWRFRPEIVDGRAVPSRVEIPIEFALTANR
ncbi:energy transducer TonB [Pseudomonas alkylphenolica]|uniref:Ferric siderophore transport system binding protein TonB n=1 Tax=Pseudomonas alkylphenolica TaxID=237609 RepID=A0A077FB56_9PSED|nr:energy transducer TonB [Pseudomonas alkylphenolica]AIL62513.1 ferric siderophore transport system binding protein TonB [Pseudomonas alkylphenolica]